MSKVLLAVVKESGRAYIVQQRKLSPSGEVTVYCWGAVTKFRGAVRTHGPSVSFSSSAVDLIEVAGDEELSIALFEDHLRALKAAGHELLRKGHKVIDLTASRALQRVRG